MKNKEKSPIDFNNLIINFLNGSASPQETESLIEWINHSQINRDAFNRIRLAWLASSQYKKCNSEQSREALNSLNKRIKAGKRKSAYFVLSNVLKIAASLLIVFISGSLATYLLMKSNLVYQTELNQEQMMHIFSPMGSRTKAVLQDGTQVWLNAGSSLTYNTVTYGLEDRQVNLIGEGYFEVTGNADKPFIVNAKDIRIVALGTTFNVKAYPDENVVETTLVEGLVKIEGEDQEHQAFSFLIQPNQHLAITAGKAVINDITLTDPARIDSERLSDIVIRKMASAIHSKPTISAIKETEIYTSWKDDRWILKGEQLGTLATMLERKYNISIEFKSEELKCYRFTGIFQNETVEQVMQVLKMTAPLTYSIDRGKVTLNIDSSMVRRYEKYLMTE